MRRRYMLGETAAEVKQYFEVSVYRNILDMLKTMETVLGNAANLLYNLSYTLREAKGGSHAGDSIKGAIGYSVNKLGVGRSDPKHDYAAYYYAVQQMKKHLGFAPSWATDAKPLRKPAEFDGADMLNLARQIEWEMNRVRLPVPHNFRQITSWVKQHGNFVFKITTTGGGRTARKVVSGGDKVVMNYFEMIRVIGDELRAVKEMREEVRKEIDAANLAAKVEEQTIRNEQEALISRAQAAEEAAEREALIRAEKARTYRADYDLLVARLKTATTREEQDLLLGQIATVVAAINGLQVDSVGRVVVPEVALLPTAAELTAAAQAVVTATQQRQEEIAQQAEQVAVAHDDLAEAADQAAAAGDTDAAAQLAQQAAEQRRAFEKMQAELVKLSARVDAARVAQTAAVTGDSLTAADKLDEATAPAAKPGLLVPLLGVLLLALN